MTRRIGHGATDAAADDHGCAEVVNLGRLPKRSDDIEDRVARLEHVQQPGRLAYGLHDNGDGAGLGISVGQREGDTFARIVEANDDELAGALFFGDPRRFDLEQLDASRDVSRSDDGEHG